MGNKILVADDDTEMLSALTKMLSGYEVISANDGEAAWALAVFENPDMMLLDVDMPGMNGIDVLKKISALPNKPAVIMITGDRTKETAAKAREIGIAAYITKPFEKAEVLEQVERAFAAREKGPRA